MRGTLGYAKRRGNRSLSEVSQSTPRLIARTAPGGREEDMDFSLPLTWLGHVLLHIKSSFMLPLERL